MLKSSWDIFCHILKCYEMFLIQTITSFSWRSLAIETSACVWANRQSSSKLQCLEYWQISWWNCVKTGSILQMFFCFKSRLQNRILSQSCLCVLLFLNYILCAFWQISLHCNVMQCIANFYKLLRVYLFLPLSLSLIHAFLKFSKKIQDRKNLMALSIFQANTNR